MDDLLPAPIQSGSTQSQQPMPATQPVPVQTTSVSTVQPTAAMPAVSSQQNVQAPVEQAAAPVANAPVQPSVSAINAQMNIQPSQQQVPDQPWPQMQQGTGLHKEFAPMPPMLQEVQGEEYNELITPSEPEVHLPPELKEAGIETGEDVKEQAFFQKMQQASSEFTTQEGQPLQPVAANTQPAAMPLTIEQAAETKKKGSIWDSLTWLATLVMYHWKKSQKADV